LASVIEPECSLVGAAECNWKRGTRPKVGSVVAFEAIERETVPHGMLVDY
jgi:hypothetical protein